MIWFGYTVPSYCICLRLPICCCPRSHTRILCVYCFVTVYSRCAYDHVCYRGYVHIARFTHACVCTHISHLVICGLRLPGSTPLVAVWLCDLRALLPLRLLPFRATFVYITGHLPRSPRLFLHFTFCCYIHYTGCSGSPRCGSRHHLPDVGLHILYTDIVCYSHAFVVPRRHIWFGYS